MAKYLAQVVVLGAQVVARAFARALQQEYAASRVTSSTRGENNRSSRAEAAVNAKHGMTLQEARDILNVHTQDSEQIRQAYEHLLAVNDKAKGGSLYLQSKEVVFNYLTSSSYPRGIQFIKRQFHTHCNFDSIFSKESKMQCIARLQSIKPFKFRPNISIKEASVMVPLCIVSGQPSVLFTLRSSEIVRNKNDVSFPGGMRDLQDINPVSAALRETEEEIGIPSNSVDVWTTMTPVPSKHGKIRITPVIGNVNLIEPEKCKFNPVEVEIVFSQTIESLCDPQNIRYTQYKTKVPYILPVFVGGEYRIWGITAVILHHVLAALIPQTYQSSVLHI